MMTRALLFAVALAGGIGSVGPQAPPSGPALPPPLLSRSIGEADCSGAKLGDVVPAAAIGLPVSGVTLSAPRWIAATDATPARCEVDGSIAAVDRSPTARPIQFRVWLPAEWNGRAVQQGGGGMNGTIPDLSGARFSIGGRSPAQLGFVTYGSDSGHQSGAGRGTPPAPGAQDWALNDEAIVNLGHAQLKKTHDAAFVIIERAYGARPARSYFTGTSQGGREALTVAQRYPADYDGVIANVPIVNFSSLMLAPELIRIREKPLAHWIPRAKVNAIRGEFMRQCDRLDGLVDGIINNYAACRATFDVSQDPAGRRPWAAKRCPDNVDPNPADTSGSACLTDGQIGTLEFTYQRYRFAAPLANGVTSFGMWLPNTDPSGSGLILDERFAGQEGAADGARTHSALGILGVTGFLMKDLRANPLDYVEGGKLSARRQELSSVLDSTDPNLRPFAGRGGRMIVTIGTNDTLASPGAQLDYYQSVIDAMGRAAVDGFARFFVIPQAGHNLAGSPSATDGEGRPVASTAIASDYERFAFLVNWVERGVAPGMSLRVSAGTKTMPLCSYPAYPKYVGGPPGDASSYNCS